MEGNSIYFTDFLNLLELHVLGKMALEINWTVSYP